MNIGGATHELPHELLLPAAPDPEFDRMAALTRRILHAPVALVSLPNDRGQILPGAYGVTPELDASRSNTLDYSFCQHVVRTAKPLIVSDTRQVAELASSPATTELGLLAYAGMPLVDERGTVVGSLCVIDTEPRQWSTPELEVLSDLAEACSAQLRLRVANARSAILADRDRIGRTLGEGVIRELFGLSMTLGSLRGQVDRATATRLAAAIETVDDVVQRMRDTIFDVAS